MNIFTIVFIGENTTHFAYLSASLKYQTDSQKWREEETERMHEIRRE